MVKRINPSQFDFYFGASKETIEYAKELRKRMTPAEIVLWENLRNRLYGNLKFRRQHPIGRFIADFYCPEKKLIIELDGSVHDRIDQKEYDQGRTEEIKNFDINVLRFRNEEVLNGIEIVLNKIRDFTK